MPGIPARLTGLRPLHVELVRDPRAAVGLPGDVDLVVAPVSADSERAPEPAPEAELALLHQLALEHERPPLDAVVAPLLLAHAVDEHRERPGDGAGQRDAGGGHDAPMMTRACRETAASTAGAPDGLGGA